MGNGCGKEEDVVKAERECVIHLSITPLEARIIRAALNRYTEVKEEHRDTVMRMIYELDMATSSERTGERKR